MDRYDEMKKYLNISRKGVLKQILTETEEFQQEEETDITSDEELNEQQEFATNVTKSVKFIKFKLTPNNALWGGLLFPGDKDIEFYYSLDSEDGCYVTVDMLELSEDTVDVLQKLQGYYKKWYDKWSGEVGVTSNRELEE